MNKFENYYKAVNFLEGLMNLPLVGDYMIDRNNPEMYLKRIQYFLKLLGNPEKNLKCIHITGTAGKGTVTNMVHEILSSTGARVGSFTSPFVTTSIEKIKINDKYISPDEFAKIVEFLKPYIDEAYTEGPYGRPSYFEIFLAVAFIYFKQKKCDWVVLEVGLGGRYDATNVINHPIVTAITNIDYDHTELLGNTLEKIAWDKAGIIKKGSQFFTTEQRPSLVKIFKDICDEQDVPFHQLPHQSAYHEYNRALATAITKNLGVADEDISRGIKKARLQCRFEIMQTKPFVVLDGAHNRAKVKSTIDNLEKMHFRKLYLVIGIAENKDHVSILEQIIPRAGYISFTRFQNKDRKCMHPKELMSLSKKYFKHGAISRIYLDPDQALAESLKKAKRDDLILVVGSFFLAGGIRKHWFREELMLKKRKGF